MYDLIVVGAGIFGSTLTRMARLRGLDAHLIGNEPPSSLAALALSRPAWSQSHGEARAWYESLGAVRASSALVSRAGWDEPRRQHDWLLIDPGAPLLKPDERMLVSGWEPGLLFVHSGELRRARLVVISAPVHGWAPDSFGSTVVGSNDGWDPGLHVHWLRPYHFLASVVEPLTIRLGSSVASSQDEADKRAIRMLGEAREAYMPVPTDWKLTRGKRFGKGTVRSEQPGLVLMEGMARSGYAEAPKLARELLDRYPQLTK